MPRTITGYQGGAMVEDHRRLAGAENWMFTDDFVERLRYEIDPQWHGEIPRTTTAFFAKAIRSSPAMAACVPFVIRSGNPVDTAIF